MKKQETSNPSSFTGLDLDNLVEEAKKRKIEDVTKEECQEAVLEATSSYSTEENPPSFPQSWSNFLVFLNKYKQSKRKDRPRSFYIEKEIIEVLENCCIENSKTTDIINGILRSFINDHKALFRESLKPRPTLISLD